FQQRKSYVAEDAPVTCAVDASGFDGLRRDRLEAGGKKQEQKRSPFPHVDEDHRNQRGVLTVGPGKRGGVEAELAESAVENAELGIEDQAPSDRGDDRRKQHGDEESGAEERFGAGERIDQKREGETENKFRGQRDDGQDDGLQGGGSEDAVAGEA